MAEVFSRYLTPLTYAMWVTILIGGVDHFLVDFLPPVISEINIFIMLPLLAIVWFGHKHRAKYKSKKTG